MNARGERKYSRCIGPREILGTEKEGAGDELGKDLVGYIGEAEGEGGTIWLIIKFHNDKRTELGVFWLSTDIG